MNGKGDTYRPVDRKAWDENYDRIFRKESVMGVYDIVMVACPKCGEETDFQSKSGPCEMKTYKLADCPPDVMMDVNRHTPAECRNCKTKFGVAFTVVREAHKMRVEKVQVVKY